jgi:hypothetical protein
MGLGGEYLKGQKSCKLTIPQLYNHLTAHPFTITSKSMSAGMCLIAAVPAQCKMRKPAIERNASYHEHGQWKRAHDEV